MSPTNHKDPTVSVKMSSGWYWRCAARMFECYGLLLIYFLGNKFRRLVWKVAYSNARNSLVSSLILKDKVSFEKYFQFPVECRKPHSSRSIRSEMAGDCINPSVMTKSENFLRFALFGKASYTVTHVGCSWAGAETVIWNCPQHLGWGSNVLTAYIELKRP